MCSPKRSGSTMDEIRVATRGSRLALAQAGLVADRIRSISPATQVTLVPIDTAGDRDQTGPIARLTELGAFVRAVQNAVLDDRADIAVHSLKDLPVEGPSELVLAGFPERASAEDAVVGSSLDELGPGSVVGTGSPRRVTQLRRLHPLLETAELRGNVDTRLRKVSQGEVEAAILAAAGLERLGKADRITQLLAIDDMVPAPGQGALAVEARPGSRGAEIAAALDDSQLRPLLVTERQLLAESGAGCRSALGALAVWEAGNIRLTGFVSDERGPRTTVVVGGSPTEVVTRARRELGI